MTHSNSKNLNFKKRKKARQYVFQLIYSWQLSSNFKEAKCNFLDKKYQVVDSSYLNEVFNGVIKNVLYLDKIIEPCSSWKLSWIGQVERAILRLSTFELFFRDDIPIKVVLNEAVELAKSFGSSKSSLFVNGVLGKIVNLKIKKKF